MAIGKVEMVTIHRVSLHPLNARKFRGSENKKRIMDAIKQRGMEYPLKVVSGSGGMLLCYDGGFRFEAAKMLGLKEVPVIIENGISETELVLKSFDAEDKSVPLTPIEQAEVFNYLLKKLGSLDKVAGAVGRNIRYINEMLALLKLTGEWKQLVLKGELGWLAAYHLSKEPKDIQKKAFGYYERDKYHGTATYHIDDHISKAKGKGKSYKRRLMEAPDLPVKPTRTDKFTDTRTCADWSCPKCDAVYETHHLPDGKHAFKRRDEE